MRFFPPQLLLLTLPFVTVQPSGCGEECADADQDGVCDPDDVCAYGDDGLDQNQNGTPDACEQSVTALNGQLLFMGIPFRFVGANSYYLMTYAADPSLRPAVDEVLEEAAARGVRVIRTWAFSEGPGWNSLQPSPGVYDERVFQGLDYVIDRAHQLGLRLLLPLVNYWPDYGGMDQYVAWSSTATEPDDFYTDDTTRTLYRNHLATLTARVNSFNGRRYRDEPAILGWELANEPRCTSDPAGNTLAAWISEMAPYLKSLDARHLITVGMEGFYSDGTGPWYLNGSQGTDFVRHHQLPGIDFAVAHSWPDAWGLSQSATMDLVERQINDAALALNMPFVLEEFGKARDDVQTNDTGWEDWGRHTLTQAEVWAPAGHRTSAQAPSERLDGASASPALATTLTRDAWFDSWLDLLQSRNTSGGLYWAAYHDAYPDYDGYGVYDPADTSTLLVLDTHIAQLDEL